MARSPSSPIILPCPAKRVSAFSVVDGSVYRPRIKCAPSPDRGIDNSALSAQMDLTLFVYTPTMVQTPTRNLAEASTRRLVITTIGRLRVIVATHTSP